MSNLPNLRIDGLHERHPGITQALSECYAEAASVCWSRHHQPPITVSLKHGDTDTLRLVNFAVPDARTRAANANEIDATETGAYGVSLAAVEEVSGLVAVGRAETRTGADWYVAPSGTEIEDLENCIRLEVSGVSAGCLSEIRRATSRPPSRICSNPRTNSKEPAADCFEDARIQTGRRGKAQYASKAAGLPLK